MKSHSLEHRSQEQPLLQPKQVPYCWQGSERSAALQTRTREKSLWIQTTLQGVNDSPDTIRDAQLEGLLYEDGMELLFASG